MNTMKNIIWFMLFVLIFAISFGCENRGDQMVEQAVIFYGNLSDNEFGTAEEREQIFKLEDELIDKITSTNSGEYDGHEFSEGKFILYMYSKDANALYSIVKPILKESKLTSGGYAVVRYGPPGSKGKKISY